MILFILCALPTLFRAWQDRKGQTKQKKLLHNVWVYGSSLLAVGIVSAIQRNESLIYEASAALPVWRVCLFDYVVHAFLKRYSKTHKEKDINIWTYTGSTKSTYFWEKWMKSIPWWIRLALRVCLFGLSVWWFL